MIFRAAFGFLVLGLGALFIASPAHACGWEAPSACGDNGEDEAKWLLKRVVSAVEADKEKALVEFTRGEAGFRTAESYVFCIGPTGVMTAHPSPMLQGQDVRDLHDNTGNYFIATMMKTAKPGAVSEIKYLFPRPGSSVATQKTTYYTRAGDQVCAVGVYEPDQTITAAATPDARVAQLRQRLNAEMPSGLSADWTAFLQALDTTTTEHDAAVAKAREQMNAAAALLAPTRQASSQ